MGMRIPFPLVPTEYKNLPQGVIGTTDDFLRIFFTLRVTPLSVFSAIVAGEVGMDGLMKWKLRVPVYPRTRPFSYICISLTPKFHPIIPL